MALRTAGKLGCGGGPGRRVQVFFPPRPTVLGEAQVLQKGIGDAGHQRVPVQSRPRAALEVAEAQFPFELLMRLLAHRPVRLSGTEKQHKAAIAPGRDRWWPDGR